MLTFFGVPLALPVPSGLAALASEQHCRVRGAKRNAPFGSGALQLRCTHPTCGVLTACTAEQFLELQVSEFETIFQVFTDLSGVHQHAGDAARRQKLDAIDCDDGPV